MDLGSKLLSDITFYRTYAKVLPSGRKENWSQVCDRYQQYMLDRLPETQHDLLAQSMEAVRLKLVVPSMRLMQFAGEAVEREPARAYNCSFLNVTSLSSASELLYLAACGVGVGYSIQKHHTEQCAVVGLEQQPSYVIPDSREGWADSIVVLLKSPDVVFDYTLVRPAGAKLSLGGWASGPGPLKIAHERIREVLKDARGRRLSPFEWHVVMTSIGEAIVAGGVRRTALISLFDRDDEQMLKSKAGAWWERYPQFARANNSAVLPRGRVTEEEFKSIIQQTYDSYAGEPGILWTSNTDWGTNPCAEIALRNRQFCNLTEINLARVTTVERFASAAMAATALGTFQATIDNFNYLPSLWKKNQEEERLLGVSLTGQAQDQRLCKPGLLQAIAEDCVYVNAVVSHKLGIKPAARITTTKPSGTTSTVLGTAAGIHAVHAPMYIRRIGIEIGNPLEVYLKRHLPSDFYEECGYDKGITLFKLPIKMDGIVRTEETAIQLLERARNIQENWIAPGHNSGDNMHNVSLTVSYKEEEKEGVKQWMWNNQTKYAGISLLPEDNGTYAQAPYTTCDSGEYERLSFHLYDLDLSEVVYESSDDSRGNTSGCEGLLCELPQRS